MHDKSSSFKIQSRDVLWVMVTAVMAMIAGGIVEGAPAPPVFDAMFYVQLALGVSEFGVLGKFTRPDIVPEALGATPLYPAFLALLTQMDSGLRESLICNVAGSPGADCQSDYLLLAVVQGGLMSLGLVCVWLTAQILTGHRSVAWLAMAAAVLSGIPAYYARLFLTEALVLPLFALFTLFLLLAWRRPNAAVWPLLMGVTIGLLALVRPTFFYLFWFLVAGWVFAIAVDRHRKQALAMLLLFGFSYGLITVPWVVHNHREFGTASIDARGYGGMTLALRVEYNKMSMAEWGVAFVYWFPDFGDQLAERIFPPRLYERLKGDSFQIGAGQPVTDSIAAAQSRDKTVAHLMRNEILTHPVKHALVTLALTWRGMFINRYWGIAGWICALWLLFRSLRAREWDYTVLLLPPAFLVVFHAAVSVSIPRYNIVLLPVLSIALAVALVHLSCRITKRFRNRSTAKE